MAAEGALEGSGEEQRQEIDIEGLLEEGQNKIVVKRKDVRGQWEILNEHESPISLIEIRNLYGGGEYRFDIRRPDGTWKKRNLTTKLAGRPKEVEIEEPEDAEVDEDRIAALEDEIDTLRNTIEYNQKQLLERLSAQQQIQGTQLQKDPTEMAVGMVGKLLEIVKNIMPSPQQPQRSETDLLIKGMELGSGFGGADVDVEKVRAFKEIMTSPEVWENIKETAAIVSGGEEKEGGGGGKTGARETIQLLRFLGMAKKGIERNTGPEIYIYMLEDQMTPEQLDKIKALGIDGFYKLLEQHKDRLKNLYPTFTSDAGKDWINDFFGLLKATSEEREAILSGELGEPEPEPESKEFGFKPEPKANPEKPKKSKKDQGKEKK